MERLSSLPLVEAGIWVEGCFEPGTAMRLLLDCLFGKRSQEVLISLRATPRPGTGSLLLEESLSSVATPEASSTGIFMKMDGSKVVFILFAFDAYSRHNAILFINRGNLSPQYASCSKSNI
jgi:hypothetical protein